MVVQRWSVQRTVTLDGCMLDDSLFSGGKSRPKLTRSQKRYQRCHHTQMLKTGALDISAEELQKLQMEDPSLETLRVSEGKSETHFYDSEGLLFRRWIPRGRDAESAVNQLVLPTVLKSSAATGT